MGQSLYRQCHIFELNGATAATADWFFIQRYAAHDQPNYCLSGGDMVRFLHCDQQAYLSHALNGSQVGLQSDNTWAYQSIQGLWQIQHVNVQTGQLLTIHDSCCIRHVASRQYLTLHETTHQAILTPHRTNACYFRCRLESGLGGLLYLRDSRPLYLEHVATGQWLGIISSGANKVKGFHRFAKDQSWQLQIVKPEEATQGMLLLSLVPQLRSVVETLRCYHSLPSNFN